MTIFQFLTRYYPVVFLWALGIVVALVYRRSWPLHYRVLAGFVLIYLVLDTTGSIMAAFYKRNNLYLNNILYGVQFVAISYFYYHELKNKTIRKMLLAFLIGFPILFVINSLLIQGFFTWQSYTLVLGASFTIAWTIAYLWQLYNSEETQSIFGDPVFWFSLSWLLYFIVMLPYGGMLNYLLEKYPTFTYNYYIKVIDLVDCLHKLLLTIGFLCMRARAKLY